MPLSIVCPKCKTKSAAPDDAVGKNVRCPNCGVLLAVPSSGKTQAPPVVTTKVPIPVASFADPAKGNLAPQQSANIPIARALAERLQSAHSLGIASLVLGCLALMLSLIPCIGTLSLPLSVLGLLLGIGGGIVLLHA